MGADMCEEHSVLGDILVYCAQIAANTDAPVSFVSPLSMGGCRVADEMVLGQKDEDAHHIARVREH